VFIYIACASFACLLMVVLQRREVRDSSRAPLRPLRPRPMPE
jgi:hypothetical protein